MEFMLVTLDTSHADRSELKASAPLNMKSMLVTLDTFHADRSELKALAPLNMKSMSVHAGDVPG